jgi:ABC-type multidrug transport system fused ATPase/permease subunit
MALSTTESEEIHLSDRVSQNAAGSTFAEVDDREREIPAIEFRDVVLFFDDRVILNKLSFSVRKGETKIILGGSGGGKSTVIKLVLGLLKPDEGRVLVDGEDIALRFSFGLRQRRLSPS